ncbi:Diacylglycerol kinase [Actinomyces bovis]|uniref:Diacylglycerol kinase n=1 Tax=Actinomyces bovis TaxID=1658 RepID=A0ABY1VPG0_9ACTO|nr:diacylglycerol kinase family protein [Actinomyces bovis]SPT54015.1 Diacylglycerol kinase [Actinomyces bovis]VEG53852.1 Diacylglycerol kinase [Actinomyces israelii]
MRVGLVVNPTSGRGRHGGAARIVTTALVSAGHDVVEAYGTSYDESRRSATALMEDRVGLDALVVVGGDGTVHLGLDVVAQTPVPLGIVAVGTGNDLARHLGLPTRDPNAAATVITEALAGRGSSIRLDAIHTTRPDGSPVPDEHEWSLAVCSAGIDAAVNARANTLSWPAGEGRYVRAVMEELARLAPYGYRITTGSGTWEGPALLLAAANTRYFGGGMDLSPEASPTDGLLDVLRLEPVSRRHLLRLLKQLFKGDHLGDPAVHLERTQLLTIEALPAEQGWRRPPQPMADGEAIADLPLCLEAVRDVVTVLLPA